MSEESDRIEDAPVKPHRTAGWGGDEVVLDQSGTGAGDTGWESERVVRDHAGDDAQDAPAGWSGGEVVRDQGEAPTEEGGGWSGSEVVKDKATEERYEDEPLI